MEPLIWDSYFDTVLTDYVFDSNISAREIAMSMGTTETDVKRRIRELGLSWIRRRNGHLSRGQAALTYMVRKLLPGAEVVTEHPIGERLRLDVYCPKYKLAVEYHGRQHFMYVEHFHRDKEGFHEARRRDERKAELCAEQGITLVVFRYNDALDEDSVFNQLLYAIRMAPVWEPEEEKISIKGNPYYEAAKERNREYRKAAYRRAKEKRGRSR